MATIIIARKDLPIRRPQTIQIGDDWIGETFVHKNPDGTAVDLAGATVAGQLQLADGTIVNLVMDVVTAEGKYTPTLPAATTAGFTSGKGLFEVDVTDSLGAKTTYWAGPVAIKATLPPAGG